MMKPNLGEEVPQQYERGGVTGRGNKVGKNTIMLRSVVGHLRCPFCDSGGLRLEISGATTPNESVDRVDDATLTCPGCGRTTQVIDRIWHALGDHRWSKTPAQISNVVPPTPQLYEKVWRRRSLTLLSGRPFPIAEELAELATAMNPAPGAVFVDVGCSEGLYARALADAGATVIAVDHSRGFLRRVVLTSGDRPVVAVRAVAQSLPLASAAFAGAVLGASLNEIGDQATCLDEMARVTKVGGRMFSMSLTTATTRRGRTLQRLLGPTGIAIPSVDETIALAQRAHWSIVDQRLDRIVLRVTGERLAV